MSENTYCCDRINCERCGIPTSTDNIIDLDGQGGYSQVCEECAETISGECHEDDEDEDDE